MKCTHCKKVEAEEDLRYCLKCYKKFLKWLDEGGSAMPESLFKTGRLPVKKEGK